MQLQAGCEHILYSGHIVAALRSTTSRKRSSATYGVWQAELNSPIVETLIIFNLVVLAWPTFAIVCNGFKPLDVYIDSDRPTR
jgi:hypothetical protein